MLWKVHKLFKGSLTWSSRGILYGIGILTCLVSVAVEEVCVR